METIVIGRHYSPSKNIELTSFKSVKVTYSSGGARWGVYYIETSKPLVKNENGFYTFKTIYGEKIEINPNFVVKIEYGLIYTCVDDITSYTQSPKNKLIRKYFVSENVTMKVIDEPVHKENYEPFERFTE